ncbi:MAG: hypothetical protein IJ945_02205 [Oscillospiraceae bacterium]|nr:hypothetical protein [Oscillospiraceae bacterium]
MDAYDVTKIVRKQLAKDYNCKESDFDYGNLIVTEGKANDKRAMRAVFFGGAGIFCAEPGLVSDLRRIFEGKDPEWIFETNSLIMLSEILYLHGHNVDNIHEYFVPDVSRAKTEPKFETETIESGFDRFKNEAVAKDVFDLESHGPIKIVIAAKKNGKTVAMAAAFEESEDLWKVSIGVAPEERFGCAAENILGLIKDAVLEKGKIPYYGGVFSRNISPNTGSNAGFFPCWSQIQSRPRDDEFLGMHGTR